MDKETPDEEELDLARFTIDLADEDVEDQIYALVAEEWDAGRIRKPIRTELLREERVLGHGGGILLGRCCHRDSADPAAPAVRGAGVRPTARPACASLAGRHGSRPDRPWPRPGIATWR